MIKKICPFCEKKFDANIIKSHIIDNHMDKPAVIKNERSEQIKTEANDTYLDAKPITTNILDIKKEVKHEPFIKSEEIDIPDLQTFNCNICNIDFGSHHVLETHINLVHSDSLNSTDNIATEGKPNLSITSSMDTFDPPINGVKGEVSNSMEEIKYWCTECNIQFAKEQSHERHMKFVHKLRKSEKDTKPNFKCDQCDRSYPKKNTLNVHKKRDHENVRYECKECNKVITSKHMLRKHLKLKHGHMLQFDCKRCDKSFASKSNLTEHIKRYHENDYYKCDQCGKVYKGKVNLEFHINRQHKNVVYSFKCKFNQCNKSYPSSSGFYYHNLRDHQKKRYTCDNCDKVFTTKNGLEYHVSHGHKKQQNSDICEKSSTSEAVNLHGNQISETVQLNCDQCDNKFVKRQALQDHIKARHQNVESVLQKCDQCNKTFVDKISLSHHIQTMHDITKYPCGDCSAVFSKIKNLHNHCKAKHNKQETK